uniref:BACK domain-containing protein n=1 Tax=Caenorhabditis tropicalis TaxID=1561998 RepID=A0A1I7UBE2_9PELO
METDKKSSESRKGKGAKEKAAESESNVKSKQSNTNNNKKKDAGSGARVIRLLGNRSVYHVAVEDFVKVSQLAKQQQSAGNLMTSVDLHRFSDHSIMAFVNYVQNREIKSALTYYAITELVTLAHTFQMKDLKMCLEDCIIEAAKSSEADLLQTMILCDVAHVNPDTERALQYMAIENIEKLVALPDFHKMPSHQLYQILSSCDLVITHEMFVADVVILWLSEQNHVNAVAPSLLSCIRTKFLSPVDRTIIIERLNQLNMPYKLVRLATRMLESPNNQRICLNQTHIRKNLGRCGQVTNPTPFNAHSSLPLSRPAFNTKMKKSKEPKSKPTFNPATAPRVIDLINADPKSVQIERTIEKKDFKRQQKEAKKAKKASKTSKKSRCACIDYVKSKMSKKNYKKGPTFKDPNAVKIKPPGTSSKKSDSTTKTSVPSKMSSSSKTNPNSSRLEKNLEKRRANKRGKIQGAIKTSKSKSDQNLSKSMKSTKSSMSSRKTKTIQSIYDYTPNEKKWIIWSVAAGTIIGTIPLNMLYVKFGARYPFLIAGLASCVSTALIPWSAKTSYFFLILLRFIQGFAYSADFAAIGLMTVRWAPLSETATFLSILTCFNGIASTITNVGTGQICESSLGWKWSYYLHAIVGLALFIVWFLVYIDHPQETKRVSNTELQKIQKNKSEAHLSKKCDVPYRKLVRSPVILCVWINAFFDLTAAIMFSTYVPLYLHEVLKFGIAETGFYSSLILGLSMPVRFSFAIVSDKLKFIPMENRGWALFCFITCMCCIGVNSGGFYKSGVLHSRQFAHVVITAIQWMKCLALFVAPALVSMFVSVESERKQWIGVYLVLGSCMFITNFVSFFILTDKPATWTETEDNIEKL